MLSLCVHYELCTGERAAAADKKCARLLHFWGENQQQQQQWRQMADSGRRDVAVDVGSAMCAQCFKSCISMATLQI